MKKLFYLTIALLLPGLVNALTVGPDNFGYISIDSAETGGPSYEFVDISVDGTRLTFFDADNLANANADDGVAPSIPLSSLNNGQGFKFYGVFYNTVHMSSNGFLTFTLDVDADSLSNVCGAPNATNPDNIIAAVWDDLVLSNPPNATSGGYVKNFDTCPYSTGGSDACVVFQWDNADHFGAAIDSFDFQIVLYANNNILMNFGPGNPETGSGSSTMLENDAGSDGVTHVCNSAASLPASSSVLFTPNGLQLSLAKTVVIDTGVETCGTTDSVTITPGQAVRYCFTVTNSGVLPIDKHTLIDDVEGTILNDFPYVLAPGSSAFITQVATVASSQTTSAIWTGKNSALSLTTLDSDSATVIIDADGDGQPDEGDGCPADPAKIAPGQCGCGVSDTDSDSDGTANCNDACPSDQKKTAPGVCGCTVQELDLNTNGVIDCLATPDLRAQASALLTQVGKLKAKSARRQPIKPKTIKASLQALIDQINKNAQSLQINAGFDLAALKLAMEKAVKKALKNGSPTFAKNKKLARKAINRFLAGLSA